MIDVRNIAVRLTDEALSNYLMACAEYDFLNAAASAWDLDQARIDIATLDGIARAVSEAGEALV